MKLKSTLKAIKLNESTISMVLGAIVIVVVGILVINYFSSRQEGTTIPPIDIEKVSLPATHTVSEDETLWSISEKYYGSGYNWVDIANENDLRAPYQIEVNQELSIPDVEPKLVTKEAEKISPTPREVEEEVEVPVSRQKTAYKIQSGDTLWSIAQGQYGSGYHWVDIAEENKLTDPNIIEVGQEISLPAQSSIKAIEQGIVDEKAAQVEDSIAGATYEVKEGDYLWEIAVRAYGDGYKWVDIARENKLTNPNLIHPGNKLTIPR